jgi:hypothetical protein
LGDQSSQDNQGYPNDDIPDGHEDQNYWARRYNVSHTPVQKNGWPNHKTSKRNKDDAADLHLSMSSVLQAPPRLTISVLGAHFQPIDI